MFTKGHKVTHSMRFSLSTYTWIKTSAVWCLATNQVLGAWLSQPPITNTTVSAQIQFSDMTIGASRYTPNYYIRPSLTHSKECIFSPSQLFVCTFSLYSILPVTWLNRRRVVFRNSSDGRTHCFRLAENKWRTTNYHQPSLSHRRCLSLISFLLFSNIHMPQLHRTIYTLHTKTTATQGKTNTKHMTIKKVKLVIHEFGMSAELSN